jgi:predicted amidohydrolase YtcJ
VKALLVVMTLPLAADTGACAGSRDLRLVNGNIVSMAVPNGDARNSILHSVTIQRGRFDFSGAKPSPCTKTINLHGRTAVPGLIDNHNPIVLLGLRPGYDTRIETAASIKDVQADLAERAESVPPGKFITAMGGWNPAQFAEKPLPTLEELDAAAADHPVLVFLAFTGPAATNSMGRAFFIGKGIR